MLATVGAIVSFLGGDTQNKALLYKNEAVLERARGLGPVELLPGEEHEAEPRRVRRRRSPPTRRRSSSTSARSKRYAAEKDEIEKDAETHEAKSKAANEKSEHALHPHHYLAISMTLLQIAIALASITVLTQKRWLLYGAGIQRLAGAVLGVLAYTI